MPSKRKLVARMKRAKLKLQREMNMRKPGEMSRYALKKRRMASGWINPRSPIKVVER